MSDLQALQAAFQRSVMQGDEGFVGNIVGTAKLSRELRLAIYENAYRSRLEEALAADCPVLQQLLGEKDFSTLGQAYIDARPSRHFSLRWFSSELANHLGYDSEQGSHEWQAEMARLELGFVDAFDAADTSVATEAEAASLASEDWPSLKIQLHPSVQLIPLFWNSLDRWRAAKQGEADPEARHLLEPVTCLIWRQDLSTRYRSLTPLEAIALQAILSGVCFAELCGVIAGELLDQEQVPVQAVGLLKAWLAAGMVHSLAA